MAWIYRIPICGGFCAPTVNPDSSLARHFSNEYTLPAPPLFENLGCIVESNALCVRIGALGLQSLSRHRKAVFSTMVLCNFFSLLCALVSALAMSTSYDILMFASWTHGEVEMPLRSGGMATLKSFWGTKARVSQYDCGQFANATSCGEFLSSEGFEHVRGTVYAKRTLWADSGACLRSEPNSFFVFSDDLDEQFEAECSSCKASLFATLPLVLGVVMQLPTMATDCQRMTEYGDVNCQKSIGVLGNAVTFTLNAMAMVAYGSACFSNLANSWEHDGTVYHASWRLGFGWRCLIVSMVVKVLDATAHLLIPTPSSRHKAVEIESVPGYLMSEGSAYVLEKRI
jgi:hypothetical protein